MVLSSSKLILNFPKDTYIVTYIYIGTYIVINSIFVEPLQKGKKAGNFYIP